LVLSRFEDRPKQVRMYYGSRTVAKWQRTAGERCCIWDGRTRRVHCTHPDDSTFLPFPT